MVTTITTFLGHEGTSWSDEMLYLNGGAYMVHIFVKTHLPITLRAVHFSICK